jgi:hypothetical protein
MATPAQVAANRANAQRSTGPRSAEGKSRSRFNALQHGVDANSIVIPGEDPEAYESLAADYRRQYHPGEPSEHFHVESMIQADWLKRRAPQPPSEPAPTEAAPPAWPPIDPETGRAPFFVG